MATSLHYDIILVKAPGYGLCSKVHDRMIWEDNFEHSSSPNLYQYLLVYYINFKDQYLDSLSSEDKWQSQTSKEKPNYCELSSKERTGQLVSIWSNGWTF